MEMGWGADKDEKGKKGGHTMTASKAVEQSTANIIADEPDQYAKAMIAETVTDGPV